ncbi:MAG: response regulator [Kiritimatiellae bacterium]|nr:response regulator [Kiritimatiellia bacterium]
MERKKILILDDQEVYLRSLEFVLRRHYDVCSASSYDESILILKNHTVDIALLDVRLSETDAQNTQGLDILEWIMKSNTDTAVFMMSAYTEFSYAEKALNLGARHFFRKPIDVADLVSVLEQKV